MTFTLENFTFKLKNGFAMRTIVLSIIIALGLGLNCQAYDIKTGRATIFLNNGNVVIGTITDASQGNNVVIITDDGTSITYARTEIRDITFGTANPAIPENKNLQPAEGYYSNPYTKISGVWWSVESTTGYSIRFNKSGGGFEELSVAGGWRFNEYVRIGLGVGGRYYFCCDDLRYRAHDWALPIYLNIRGGFMSRAERTVTPFYSFDIGCSIGDGFMVRPTIGIKIGDMRQSFLLGVSYLGQQMCTAPTIDKPAGHTHSFISFAALKLGYEF